MNIDNVYRDYLIEDSKILPNMSKEKMTELGIRLTKEEFITKIRWNREFANLIGIFVNERDMTWEEQIRWVMENTDVELENLYIVEEVYKSTTPTKIISMTYKEKEFYMYG